MERKVIIKRILLIILIILNIIAISFATVSIFRAANEVVHNQENEIRNEVND